MRIIGGEQDLVCAETLYRQRDGRIAGVAGDHALALEILARLQIEPGHVSAQLGVLEMVVEPGDPVGRPGTTGFEEPDLQRRMARHLLI